MIWMRLYALTMAALLMATLGSRLARARGGNTEPVEVGVTTWYQSVSGQVSGPEETPLGRLQEGSRLGLQLSAVKDNFMVQLTHVSHTAAVTGSYVFRGLNLTNGSVDESLLVLDTVWRFPFYADRDFFFDGTLGLDLVGLRSRAVSGAQSADLNIVAPLPTIGFLTRYRLIDPISLRGFARASNYTLGTVANSTYSIELELVYTDPDAGHTPLVDQVSLGFKYLSFFSKSDSGLPDQAEARFKSIGPTLNIVLYY